MTSTKSKDKLSRLISFANNFQVESKTMMRIIEPKMFQLLCIKQYIAVDFKLNFGFNGRSKERNFENIRYGYNFVGNNVEVDPNRTSLTGTGGRVFGGKRGGGNWRYWASVNWRSPELELNDVGFLRRTDQILQFLNVDYLWLVPTDTYRNMAINAEQLSEYDFQGNVNRLRYELAGNINWINNERTRLGIGANFSRFDNFFLRGGPRWRSANSRYIFTSFNSEKALNGNKF